MTEYDVHNEKSYSPDSELLMQVHSCSRCHSARMVLIMMVYADSPVFPAEVCLRQATSILFRQLQSDLTEYAHKEEAIP